jgi:hypothetical protein
MNKMDTHSKFAKNLVIWQPSFFINNQGMIRCASQDMP